MCDLLRGTAVLLDWTTLANAGLIFALRVADMSADSLRIISMVKGRRIRAAAFGVLEAGVFIYAISRALRPPIHWVQMAGYAGGFGVGTLTGATIAGWLTSNFVLLRVLSRSHAHEIADRLRRDSYRVTSVNGEGRDGPVSILFSVLERHLAERAMAVVRDVDEQAFVTLEPIEKSAGGYVPGLPWWRPSVRR